MGAETIRCANTKASSGHPPGSEIRRTKVRMRRKVPIRSYAFLHGQGCGLLRRRMKYRHDERKGPCPRDPGDLIDGGGDMETRYAIHLTRLMGNEWAKYNINVNAMAPGYMATDNTAQLRADPIRSKELLERIPAGRWGIPEDMRGIAVFLASEASRYITGFTIAVDGGWLAR